MGTQHIVTMFLFVSGVQNWYPCIRYTCPPRSGQVIDTGNTYEGKPEVSYIIPPRAYCNTTVDPHLHVCGCDITGVSEDAFLCLSEVAHLDMQDNCLDELPSKCLHPLTHLEMLDLNGKSYSKTIVHLSGLHSRYLY